MVILSGEDYKRRAGTLRATQTVSGPLDDCSVVLADDSEPPGAVCVVNEDVWASKVLDRHVWSMTWLADPGAVSEECLSALVTELKKGRARGYLITRIPTSRVAGCVSLQAAGLAVIETLIDFRQPSRALADRAGSCPPLLHFRRMSRNDVPLCVDLIAGHARSRFASDPVLGEHHERKAYTAWLESSVAGREQTAAIEKDGSIGGFVTWARQADGSSRIGLIAVGERFAGAGLGGALLAHVGAAVQQQRDGDVFVGTSAQNLRALRFYAKNGFQHSASLYTLRLAWP